MTIHLPISKSIAQRELILRAMRGEDLRPLLTCPDYPSWPEDVRTMLHGLTATDGQLGEVCIDVDNDGTAMRFLTAYYAQKDHAQVVLDGCERMRHRPIRQLVEALQALGADIQYVGEDGYAPLRIRGRVLGHGEPLKVTLHDPASTQFVSALMLIGAMVETNRQSPYIQMTECLLQQPPQGGVNRLDVEPDWSSAAFWLERRALGLVDDVQFPGLRMDSLQGDKVVQELFATIERLKQQEQPVLSYDFAPCPDLYPAVAVTCHELGITLNASGLESLRLKESDRLAALDEVFSILKTQNQKTKLPTHHDHRIAMALLAAGYDVDDETCCAKSYPDFLLQLRGITRIVPRRGMNDDNRGKKWALHKLVPAAETEWVWLTDDDVRYPDAVPTQAELDAADMIILPLQMAPARTGQTTSRTLLDDLQIHEYDAIQALTMRKAMQGQAVMCAGANLLVRRDVWLDCETEQHPEIPSGDDMFLLEAAKRRSLRITVLCEGDRVAMRYAATCYAQPTLRDLLRQRMRWAGKAPHYTDRDIIRTGIWTVISNLLVVLCPLWLIGKWVADMHLIHTYTHNKLTATFCVETLLLTILYPWYMLICLIGGFFRKSW